MGSVAGAIEVLERIVRPLGAWAIVPGHGPVFNDAGPLDATLDYLKFVQDLASRALEAGLSPLEAARDADLGYFASWPDSERIVGNLHRACAELSGYPRGAPVDVTAALGDMVAYNGGAPLTCLAWLRKATPLCHAAVREARGSVERLHVRVGAYRSC